MLSAHHRTRILKRPRRTVPLGFPCSSPSLPLSSLVQLYGALDFGVSVFVGSVQCSISSMHSTWGTVTVPALLPVGRYIITAIHATLGRDTFAPLWVTSGGAVVAFGDATSGRLGLGDAYTSGSVITPKGVMLAPGILAGVVAGGFSHSLHVSLDGLILYGSGTNDNGELPQGRSSPSLTSLYRACALGVRYPLSLSRSLARHWVTDEVCASVHGEGLSRLGLSGPRLDGSRVVWPSLAACPGGSSGCFFVAHRPLQAQESLCPPPLPLPPRHASVPAHTCLVVCCCDGIPYVLLLCGVRPFSTHPPSASAPHLHFSPALLLARSRSDVFKAGGNAPAGTVIVAISASDRRTGALLSNGNLFVTGRGGACLSCHEHRTRRDGYARHVSLRVAGH